MATAASRLVLALALMAAPAALQAQTVVAPDVGNPFALGTTAVQAGGTITIDGGTRAGANLFHSFNQFSLAAGSTASWVRGAGDGASIANVINRVTGGQASTIAGTLDSTALPNAAFYFVNPAGIIFGAEARVNVPGAAHFSTAGELRFADGERFAVATPGGSTLSVAAPESFGFLGGQGTISIQDVGVDFVPSTTSLSFTASDITVSNATIAPRGLDLIAVGDLITDVRLADPLSAARGGQVRIDGSRLAVLTNDAVGAPARVAAGEIRLSAGSLVSDSGGMGRGGDVMLLGDGIFIAPDAFVVTSARGGGVGGDLNLTAETIEIDARGATTTTGLGSVSSAAGGAGGIALTADTIRLFGEVDNPTGSGAAFIGSNVIGAGNAGDVTLNAQNLVIDIGLISTSSIGAGDGGNIRINAATQELGAALVLTSSFGQGRPGDIRIDGQTIQISGGSFGAVPGLTQESGALVIAATQSLEADGGSFSAVSASPNSSGQVNLSAPLLFLSQSRIDTQAFNDGLAGQVLIEADNLILDRVNLTSDAANGPVATGLVRLTSTGDLILFLGQYSASANGTAAGGRVEIEGRDVQLLGTIIRTDSPGFGPGDAGQIAITADTLTLDTAFVSSSSASEGRGGDVTLSARALRIENASQVLSEASFTGDAGIVSIAADTLDLRDSTVSSQANSGTGNAGSVVIDASQIRMSDSFVSSNSESIGRAGTVEVRADDIDLDGGGRPFTGISSEALSLGDAGNVTVEARTSLTVRNLAFISSASFTEASAGDINIRAGDVSVLSGGNVTSVGLRGGDAGDILITADRLVVQGEVGVSAFIASAADGGDGKAGDLFLDVGSLTVDGGAISSDTFGAGDAGQLRVRADDIQLTNFGSISSSTAGFGNAGSVDIETKSLSLDSFAVILSVTTSIADGDAGSVRIAADDIVVAGDATVSTATFGRGDAGGLDIAARSLRIEGAAEVSSSAGVGASGVAGDVRITADDLTVVNQGKITTVSDSLNKAGEIEIVAGQVTVEDPFSLISSANLADGDAGRVSIIADGIRLSNGGAITTNSEAGAAGDIDIRVGRPGLVVLEGVEFLGVIATSSGPGTGGRITISDPLAIISNGGRILAQGELQGANVVIQSRYFVNSTDRVNTVAVDGEIDLQTGFYDVSSGVVARDLSVLDASRVLRGQCPAARATGAVSQLITRPVGPYVRELAPEGVIAPIPPSAPAPGACR